MRAQAIRVYDRLRAQGLSPNSTTYNALITAHGKACNLEMARPPGAPPPAPDTCIYDARVWHVC